MIRKLHQKGWTKIAIAEETGFDRKTVSKYINNAQIPRSSKRRIRNVNCLLFFKESRGNDKLYGSV